MQFTGNSLLSLEKFTIGGVETVRGYRNNQRQGDNGFTGSVELRFTLLRDVEGIGTVELTPFFDIGKVWNQQFEIENPTTLASIGLGLRWQFANVWEATLDWGIPLNQIENEGDSLQDDGIYFSIRFTPF